MVTVAVEHVGWEAAGRSILRDVRLRIDAGEVVGLLGPNGSGKSSLLRCIYRVLKPDAGLVRLDADDVWRLSARDAARRTATVVQEAPTDFEFSVREMVLMGRSPHKGLLDRDTAADAAIVAEALARVGLGDAAERPFGPLSGGEKQRVLIARALAQQARLLVLDEPTNHLDIRHQLDTLALVRELGVTVVAALHDLNLAALFCDRVYVLDGGRIVAAGEPATVLTPTLIREVYGVACEVTRRPDSGQPLVVFLPDRPAVGRNGAHAAGSGDGADTGWRDEVFDGFGNRQNGDPAQAAQVKAWARAALGLDEETTVMVTELRCSEPGCPPLETVVAVLSLGSSVKHTIHKPLAEVAESDIVGLLGGRTG